MAAGCRCVGRHLGEYGNFFGGPGQERYRRESVGKGSAHSEQQLVVSTKVGAFVGDDRLELPGGQQGHGGRGNHYPITSARHAVGCGRVVVEYQYTRRRVSMSRGSQERGMLGLLPPGSVKVT